MAEQKTNMTDEQLAQELRKSKGGKLGGNLVLVVIGGVVLGLGQMVQGKSKEQAGRQTFDSIAPDIVGTAFENVHLYYRNNSRIYSCVNINVYILPCDKKACSEKLGLEWRRIWKR